MQPCILGRWLMITHRRPAGVAHERTTGVSNDEEAARPAGRLIDARSNPRLKHVLKHVRVSYAIGHFAPLSFYT